MQKYRAKIFIMAILFALFILITILALGGKITIIENNIYQMIAKFIRQPITNIAKFITNIGSFPVILVFIIILILIPYSRLRLGVPLAITSIIGALINMLLKNLFQRIRPDILPLVNETGYSYPSGHSQGSTVLYVALLLLLIPLIKKRILLNVTIVLCLLFPLIVGISRIYLGVHYFSDVLAGWTVGALVAIGINILWNLFVDHWNLFPANNHNSSSI